MELQFYQAKLYIHVDDIVLDQVQYDLERRLSADTDRLSWTGLGNPSPNDFAIGTEWG